MPQDRYNIVFAGALVAGADPAAVRAKLGSTFRLDAAQLDNLFSGQPVVVKRDVDLMTATRFQQAFLAAGARAEIESLAPIAPPQTGDATAGADTAGLSLAPPGVPLEELDDRGPPRQPDTSALSLLPGEGWDLSDCAPPPLPTPEFDLSALALEPLDARRREDAE
ncbi:hypothetical protein [uncultured Thiohalocapsa sp.]|uniref:hypothetical protein n=1 Tax=uncultured Thiohalocapsa sp. TaxID=768990 RepID=UPI0025EA927C|nr:hypothetical protein [uncultured Thiohalocapsa sp.]